MTEVLVLTLLGGFLALDGTSVGQFMLSRPLVAATLAGWMVGSAADGFLVGALLEIYLLVSFPVGGSRFPEGAPAAVVAVSSVALSPGPGGLAMGIALGLVWGQLGGLTITWLRTVNGRLVPDSGSGRVKPSSIVAGHLSALGLDFLRGCLVTASGVLTASVLVRFAPLWPLTAPQTLGVLLTGGVVSLGILLRSWGGMGRRGILFAVGLFAGVLGGALL